MDMRPEGPNVGEGVEIFRSLSLGGVRGRIRATLSDSLLCFESRTGQALDLKLDAIQRVHQHHTTLVPRWLGIVGLILIWVAWRGINAFPQAAVGAAGIVLSSAHVITRRPTLTIDTVAGDCHTVFGSDSTLIKLCSMIQKLQEGESLEQARLEFKSIIHDSDFPRTSLVEEVIVASELAQPPVIDSFLNSMDFEISDVLSAEVVSPQESVADPVLPDWFGEIGQPEPEIPASLLSRAQENLHTQRHNVIQNGWQSPVQQNPQVVHRNQGIDSSSYGMIQHHNGYGQNQPQPMQLTPAPTNFLPSFVGAEGAHIPSANPEMFSSPDSPLAEPEISEPLPSLVESSRKDSEPIEAEIIESEIIETPSERFSAFGKLSKRSGKKRIITRKKQGRILSGRSVMRELVGPSLEKAGAFSRRLLRGNRTGDAIRLQADQARQSQVAERIQNLAESRGGNISDEELVKDMMSHLRVEQNIPETFEELQSTDAARNNGKDGVGSILRLDS